MPSALNCAGLERSGILAKGCFQLTPLLMTGVLTSHQWADLGHRSEWGELFYVTDGVLTLFYILVPTEKWKSVMWALSWPVLFFFHPDGVCHECTWLPRSVFKASPPTRCFRTKSQVCFAEAEIEVDMQKKICAKPVSGWRNALKVDGRDCRAVSYICAKITPCLSSLSWVEPCSAHSWAASSWDPFCFSSSPWWEAELGGYLSWGY